MSLQLDLEKLMGKKRVLTRPIDRLAYASDASFYRLIPQAVVQPNCIAEIRDLFFYCQSHKIPLVFRAAGTSLSGQAITDGILVDISKHWNKIWIEAEGLKVRLQPGVIGAAANNYLLPYSRRIGPDPASIDACMVGGILANNASGMCCGVIENSYHTLESITFILPNGLTIDSGAPDASEKLYREAPELWHGLLNIKHRIEENQELKERIRSKYRTKNTTGYSLNAFLDFTTPLDIFSHLLIGSEGTLGFIAEVVLKTLPVYPLRYTGLLFFPSIQEAGNAIPVLVDSGARAIEIMDRAALRSIEHFDDTPTEIGALPPSAAGILVEYQGNIQNELNNFIYTAARVCQHLPLISSPRFTAEKGEQDRLWKLRKGMFPSIGAMRKKGTTVIIEDVAFPVTNLSSAISDLHTLFQKHGYDEAIIFGHAKDGNLHFVITQAFNTPDSIDQYQHFMSDLVELVVKKYDGALKAEHGTGRNISPFVETEWGSDAYAIMKELKGLVDPENILNPGVIINPDHLAHVNDLKTLPGVEDEVDICIECGFCEPKCPSRYLTLTPRQRIVIRREIARLHTSGSAPETLNSLLADYDYDGLDTCAVDGLCATACPVQINTGDLVKRLRVEANSLRSQRVAELVSQHFHFVENVLRIGIGAGHATEKLLESGLTRQLTKTAENVTGRQLPKWNRAVPHVTPKPYPHINLEPAQFVYFPSCISRVMGVPLGSDKPQSLIQEMSDVSRRAGIGLWIPPDSTGLCCGMPFSSKGYPEAFRLTVERTVCKFWDWSQGGKLPIVIDASSCAYTLIAFQDSGQFNSRVLKQIKLLDSIEFAYDYLIPNLEIVKLNEQVVLHPNCAARKLGLAEKLISIAQECTRSVTVPNNLNCCAYAGDRGFLFPELTASATEREAAEVKLKDYDGYYSNNLTCEIGMTLATGNNYRSFIYLVERASRPTNGLSK